MIISVPALLFLILLPLVLFSQDASHEFATAYLIWKWLTLLRRAWPSSPRRKQLFVLILGAIWITAVVVVVSFDDTLSGHPVNMFLTVLVRSIPAVLFGGIAFWWLRRAKA